MPLKMSDYLSSSLVTSQAVPGEWLMALASGAANSEAMAIAMATDSTAMDAVCSNPQLLASIGRSGAFDAIIASNMAIGKYIVTLVGLNSTDYTDMNAVVVSSTAMDAILANSTIMDIFLQVMWHWLQQKLI